jgi:hypothetical protein
MRRLKQTTPEELATIISDLKTKPVVPVYPHTAALLGIGKSSAYEAAKSGEIDTIRIGGRIKVVSSSLRKRLGIEIESVQPGVDSDSPGTHHCACENGGHTEPQKQEKHRNERLNKRA